MSIQFLLNNPHISPFILAFFVGAVLLVLAPVKYRSRTGEAIFTPFDLAKYNELERNLLFWGVVLAFGGIIGAAVISDTYGYNYTYINIDGSTTIVNSIKDRSY